MRKTSTQWKAALGEMPGREGKPPCVDNRRNKCNVPVVMSPKYRSTCADGENNHIVDNQPL